MSCDVSVILPTYNSSSTLKRALDSVFGQSLLPREIILVDDGSDDWGQCAAIAASCPDSIPIRCLHLDTNQGPATARNAGVSAARSRYLAFLDSDDVWYADKISIQYGLMTDHNLDFSTHGYIDDISHLRDDREDGHDNSPLSPSLSALSSWSFLFRNYAAPTVMVVRQKMGPFDASFRRNEDWKCWVELLSRRRSRGAHIGRVLGGGFKRAIGMSGLSQDVPAMHGSRMLALKSLMKGSNISVVQYLVGISVETAKYPVRVLRVWLRARAASGPPAVKRAQAKPEISNP